MQTNTGPLRCIVSAAVVQCAARRGAQVSQNACLYARVERADSYI
jgi:hypothetical protein